jgi:transcriptional regulator with XRE-family HTH domain
MITKRERLAQRRASVGFSQETLAKRLNVDPRTVRRWESGESNGPQPWLRPKLARCLQLSPEQLEELLTDDLTEPTTVPGGRAREDAPKPDLSSEVLLPVLVDSQLMLLPVDAQTLATLGLRPLLSHPDPRNEGPPNPVTTTEWNAMSSLDRSLLKQGLAATELPAFNLEELQHAAAAMRDAHRYLDGSVLDYLRRQLKLCKADDGTIGPDKTLPIVLSILYAVEEHAREVKPEVRPELLGLGAEAAEFAGWLCRDARDIAHALYWHDRATEWAQVTGDTAMQGYVLLKKAQLAYDERDPRHMLSLAQAVRTGPWALPSHVRAEAIQQEARAEAMLGASLDTVERKLDQARQLLDTDRYEERTLGAHYNGTLLTMQTAICYAEAGNPRHAVELYTQSLSESSFSPRDYGFFLSWMATSLALAGEPDEAASTGMASAARATSANSQRTRQELTRVVDVLAPWQHRPAVRELRHVVLI